MPWPRTTVYHALEPIGEPVEPPEQPAPGGIALHVSYTPTEQQRGELRRALNALHGYPAGVPLDAQRDPALVEAHYRLSRARIEIDLVLRVNADGSIVVERAGGVVPPVHVDATTRDELRVSEAYRCSRRGDQLPVYASTGHARPLTREDVIRLDEAERTWLAAERARARESA